MNAFFVKKLPFFIVISMIFVSCSIVKHKYQASYKISFGSGGGFTGKYDEYLLNNNGDLLKKDALTKNFKLLKSLSLKERKVIFKEIEETKLMEISFKQPYNFSYFIEIMKDSISNKIVWGNSNYPPPIDVSEMYDKLMNLTSVPEPVEIKKN